MRFFEVWSLLTLAYWLWALWDTLRVRQWMFKLPHLTRGQRAAEPMTGGHPHKTDRAAHRHTDASKTSDAPLVSVIIAAKEEEGSIEDTVKHLMNQTYPRLEIIAVNDRSQDGTGHKLDELRRWSESRSRLPMRLQVIHITSLPSGWLGKNHALYQGYQQARGNYLLFTDADVRFSPETVADAVDYLRSERADHLTLAPHMITNGFWLKTFVQYFFFSLSLFVRPWQANDDLQHRHGIGIGAFNLITRQAYEKIGTHRAIALRPDDDLQLGHAVKRAGLRQRFASGAGHIAVEWYTDLKEAVRGLEKNIFSGFGYQTWKAALGALSQLMLFAAPLPVWLLLPGWPSWIFGLSAALAVAVYQLQLRSMREEGGWEAASSLLLPAAAVLFCYVLVRSVGLTLKQGGIYWRGTFYSLQELRSMRETDSS